jgi:uncharacterized protein
MITKSIYIIFFLVTIIICLKLYIRHIEHKILFIPDKNLDIKPQEINRVWEDVYFFTEDKIKLNGWFCHSNSDDYVVIYCHGNAGNLQDRISILNDFNKIGISVFIFDYRGFGRSEGSPSEEGLNKDTEAVYEYIIQEKHIPPEKIILWGKSLGGAPVTKLALYKQCKSVVLFDTFTNAKDMASDIIPFLPIKYFLSLKLDNLSRIDKIKVPLLVIFSKVDRITPYWMGQKLFEKANEPKQFLSLSDSDHAMISDNDTPTFWANVSDFIKVKSIKSNMPKW